MVLDSKDWGMDKTKTWFEGMCRFEMSMNEQAWELVIVPLFNEISYIQSQKERLEKKLKYIETELEQTTWKKSEYEFEIKELKKELAEAKQNRLIIQPEFPIQKIPAPSQFDMPSTPPYHLGIPLQNETLIPNTTLIPDYLDNFNSGPPIVSNDYSETKTNDDIADSARVFHEAEEDAEKLPINRKREPKEDES